MKYLLTFFFLFFIALPFSFAQNTKGDKPVWLPNSARKSQGNPLRIRQRSGKAPRPVYDNSPLPPTPTDVPKTYPRARNYAKHPPQKRPAHRPLYSDRLSAKRLYENSARLYKKTHVVTVNTPQMKRVRKLHSRSAARHAEMSGTTVRREVKWGKHTHDPVATTTDIAGRTLRRKNFASPPPLHSLTPKKINSSTGRRQRIARTAPKINSITGRGQRIARTAPRLQPTASRGTFRPLGRGAASFSRPFRGTVRREVKWGKHTHTPVAITTDIAGRTLRRKNFVSPPPLHSLAPKKINSLTGRRPRISRTAPRLQLTAKRETFLRPLGRGAASFSRPFRGTVRREVKWGKHVHNPTAITTDIAGRTLRRKNFVSPPLLQTSARKIKSAGGIANRQGNKPITRVYSDDKSKTFIGGNLQLKSHSLAGKKGGIGSVKIPVPKKFSIAGTPLKVAVPKKFSIAGTPLKIAVPKKFSIAGTPLKIAVPKKFSIAGTPLKIAVPKKFSIAGTPLKVPVPKKFSIAGTPLKIAIPKKFSIAGTPLKVPVPKKFSIAGTPLKVPIPKRFSIAGTPLKIAIPKRFSVAGTPLKIKVPVAEKFAVRSIGILKKTAVALPQAGYATHGKLKTRAGAPTYVQNPHAYSESLKKEKPNEINPSFASGMRVIRAGYARNTMSVSALLTKRVVLKHVSVKTGKLNPMAIDFVRYPHSDKEAMKGREIGNSYDNNGSKIGNFFSRLFSRKAPGQKDKPTKLRYDKNEKELWKDLYE